MERITFFERYRVSVGDNGVPRELGRSGAAITYKAVDLQSGDPVALKVIPVAAVGEAVREQFEERVRATQHVEHPNIAKLLGFIVDADDFVLISEFPNGESVASWIRMHGPLSADAALRVGLQVVNALNAAAFHGLTHAAIEPSNIVIVPGQTTDGGWPSIKLTNLDTAGLKLLPADGDAPAVGAPIAPQFASPEQLQNGAADFRSEIYSLGATMCFMLTGLAPMGARLSADGGSARLPAGLRKLPRAVRDLLTDMLRPNPEERPQDPVAFAERIGDCLASIEHRQTAARKFGLPVAAPLATKPQPRASTFPTRSLAIAASICAAAILAAVLLAQPLRSALHRKKDVADIGVPVGVPEASPAAVVQNAPAPAATASEAVTQDVASAPTVASTNNVTEPAPENPPAVLQAQDAPADVAAVNGTSAPAESAPVSDDSQQRVAVNESATQPQAPAEGPVTETQASQPQPAAEKEQQTVAHNETTVSRPEANDSSRNEQRVAAAAPAKPVKKYASGTTKRRTSTASSDRQMFDRSHDIDPERPVARGTQRARFVGTTPDGQWIFDAPAGSAVADLPPDGSEQRARHRRHRRSEVQEVPQISEQPEPRVMRALPVDDDDDNDD